MKSFIIDTLIGIFAVDELGTILNFAFLNENENRMINFYSSLDSGILLEEYLNFVGELKNSGFDEFVFDNKELETLTSKDLNCKSSYNRQAPEFINFRINLEHKLNSIGFKKSEDELKLIFKSISEELIKNKISEAGAQKDTIIIQIIETLDIIKKSISLFSSRLREWYGLHFPELTDKLVEDNVILAEMVAVLGNREKFTIKNLRENFDFSEERINALHQLANDSMGAKININIIQDYANQIISLDKYRAFLENYLEDLMEVSAPNLTGIIGSLIGAKLIAKAGSLKKLAFMPASRIQLLGAEKALYRFLKSGEKRPKHGLIFQWNQIRGNKPWIRGKISRLISGKIGIAAKLDFFKGEIIADFLTKEIEQKIIEIEKKYPKPPKQEIKPKKKKTQGKKGSKKNIKR
ncbi:MAG: C/D box methylation guide ribonucleoprotein complex aNOP56 subunit [Candidatus Lokiarchaeota archaeon]|nr:C/D box methylation guide ribonucleoprotein complex aNOP56 subunit [Candidatus Lokiarchaeota archaeon]